MIDTRYGRIPDMSRDLREIFRSSMMDESDDSLNIRAQAKLVLAKNLSLYSSGPASRVISIPAEEVEFVGKRPFVLLYRLPDRIVMEIIPDRASAQREATSTEVSDEHAAETVEG
jgi:hypothetical protein